MLLVVFSLFVYVWNFQGARNTETGGKDAAKAHEEHMAKLTTPPTADEQVAAAQAEARNTVEEIAEASRRGISVEALRVEKFQKQSEDTARVGRNIAENTGG